MFRETFFTFLIIFSIASSVFITARYKDARWETVLHENKEKQLQASITAIKQMRIIERQLRNDSDALYIKYTETSNELDKILADNRRLVLLDGMRDKGQRTNSAGNIDTRSKSTTDTSDSSHGSKLSDETAEFLLNFARDADEVANYARICHEWIMKKPFKNE